MSVSPTPTMQNPDEKTLPWLGISMKWVVLVFLVFQNSAAVLLMRYSRSAFGGNDWNPQTGVIMQEIMKGVGCLLLIFRDGDLSTLLDDKLEFLKAGIPAVLYLIQNNMQYVALDYLNAPTYAVLYQLKILSTAVMSVIVLNKSLSRNQWVALCVLTSGVSCVTLSQMSSAKLSTTKESSIVPGVVAVLLAATMSGLAGVSMEKILRASSGKLWVRSFQLTFHSIVIGFGVFMFGEDNGEVLQRGFFHGYSVSVWLAIANNALGGLLIAMVIKYTDSIMKNFSQSLAIVLTAVVSFLVFDSSIGPMFVLGASLVIYAIFLYANLVPPLKLLVKTMVQRPHAL